MTGIDWVIVVAVTLSMALAAKEGFFYEVFSLAGVVVGYLLAAWEYGHVAGCFHLIPGRSGWRRLAASC